MHSESKWADRFKEKGAGAIVGWRKSVAGYLGNQTTPIFCEQLVAQDNTLNNALDYVHNLPELNFYNYFWNGLGLANIHDFVGNVSEDSFVLNPSGSGGGVVYELAITNVILPNGTVGVQYNTSFSVAGGVPPYSWALSEGALIQFHHSDEPAVKMAKQKWPHSIDFTDDMPRDPNGKLYKRKLRDPYWAGHEGRIV